MANVEKQKIKLKERIETLENELLLSLQKKSAGPAISVPKYTQNIQELKKLLSTLK